MLGPKKLALAGSAVVGTALVVLLVLNLTHGNKNVDRVVRPLYRVRDPQFTRTMGAMLGPPIIPGNHAQALLNGDEIFPAMLDAIRSAQRTLTFETFIYWSGGIGQEFAEALAARARAGVKVHVLLDAVGCGRIDGAYLERLEKAGVEVRRYNPVRWYTLGRFNNRTHRKLLIVDGRIGFTGGVGIPPRFSPAHRAAARRACRPCTCFPLPLPRRRYVFPPRISFRIT